MLQTHNTTTASTVKPAGTSLAFVMTMPVEWRRHYLAECYPTLDRSLLNVMLRAKAKLFM